MAVVTILECRARRHGPIVLGRRASLFVPACSCQPVRVGLFVSAGVVAHTPSTSAAPAMSYRL